jgi:hypothetical protein
MTSPVINEQFYDGHFIVREAEGYRSRDPGVIDNSSGSDVLYEAGLIVSLNSAGAATTAAKAGGNTGNGTVGAVSYLAGNEFGAYVVTFTSATAYTVTAPSGDVIGNGVTGTAFANQIGFTITAGGTAFVAGDGFTITVTQQKPGWQSWTGGGFTQLAILYNRVWVSAGTFKKITVMQRDCEVNMAELQWDPAVLASGSVATLQASAIASLLLTGVVAR